MTKTFALLVCGCALFAAGPALAQDYDDDGKLPDTPADVFSGPHVELGVGVDHINFKSYDDLASTSNLSANKTGLSYGGAIGYDTPLTERATIGVEFGVASGSNKYTNPALVAGTFNTAHINVAHDIWFGLRAGYAFSKKTQVFAKLAYTNTRFGVSGTDGSEVLYEGIAANGARIGAGAEQRLSRMFYVKLEFDHSQYGSGAFNYNKTTPDASAFDLRATREQAMASVGIRF